MKRRSSTVQWIVLAIAASTPGCHSECLILPCAPPQAILLTVQTSTGQPVTGASVQVDGPVQSAMLCASNCLINGGAGVYHLTITAPGFTAVSRTVVVSASPAQKCSCERVTTENLTVTRGVKQVPRVALGARG